MNNIEKKDLISIRYEWFAFIIISYILLGMMIFLQRKEVNLYKTEVKNKVEIINILEVYNKNLRDYIINNK